MKKLLFALLILIGINTHALANVPNASPLFNQYMCNSSTTQFPYSFQITATSDMTVYVTDNNGNITTEPSSAFSVDTSNVWVNYPLTGPACPTGYTITLIPSTPQTQTTTYGNRTPFTATAVGASFDKLTLIAQQLQGQVNRAFLQPVNFTGTATFPGSNPGYLIGWNSSGVLSNINNPAAVAQWSLSGANISYNTGNVSTTNTMTANEFTDGTATLTGGVLTGSVTGNVTGNLTGTVQTAAQTNITSLGTLSSLLTTGNVGIGTGVASARLLVFGGNVGIGSAAPGTSLDVQGTIRGTGFSGIGGLIGSPVSKSTGVIYQAATDGWVNWISNQSSSTNIAIYSDSNSSPSTLRAGSNPAGNSGNLTIGCFVKKGNYYEAQVINASGYTLVSLDFTPIGS